MSGIIAALATNRDWLVFQHPDRALTAVIKDFQDKISISIPFVFKGPCQSYRGIQYQCPVSYKVTIYYRFYYIEQVSNILWCIFYMFPLKMSVLSSSFMNEIL